MGETPIPPLKAAPWTSLTWNTSTTPSRRCARARILGGVLLGGMFLLTQTPQLLLIGGFALLHAFRGQDPNQLPATPEEQRGWMARYFGLCFFLGAAIFTCGQLLGHHA
jgi:hypothetical protein